MENWGAKARQREEQKIPRRKTGAVAHPKSTQRFASLPPASYLSYEKNEMGLMKIDFVD